MINALPAPAPAEVTLKTPSCTCVLTPSTRRVWIHGTVDAEELVDLGTLAMQVEEALSSGLIGPGEAQAYAEAAWGLMQAAQADARTF